MRFDQSLQYQFVLFYRGAEPTEPKELRDLPDVISRQLEGVPSLGLYFQKREIEHGMVISQVPGQPAMPPVPSVRWTAASGIWKLAWTPLRIDLVFDALGFSQIA